VDEKQSNSTDPFTELTEEEEDELFEPNIVNSTVYIISMALQIATFAINYRGNPYMESLKQNKALLYSVLGSGGTVLALTLGIVPELAAQFEIIDFPPDFRIILLQVLFADFFFSYLVDRTCLWVCGEGKMKVS
jgi:cation-transporting ATPase 13A1